MLPILISVFSGVLVLGVAALVWWRLNRPPPELPGAEELNRAMPARIKADNPMLADVLALSSPDQVDLTADEAAVAVHTADALLAKAKPAPAAIREAATLLGQASKHRPDDGTVFLLLAEAALKSCLREGGHHLEGLQWARTLLDQTRQVGVESGALSGLEAEYLLAEGDMAGAQRVLKSARPHWRVSVARARVAEAEGDAAGFTQQLKEAIERAPDYRAAELKALVPGTEVPRAATRGGFTVELDVLDALLGDVVDEIIVLGADGEDEDLLRDLARQLVDPPLQWMFHDEKGQIALKLGPREGWAPVSSEPHDKLRVLQAVAELAGPERDLRVLKTSLQKETQLYLLKEVAYWDGEGRAVAKRFKPASSVA